MKKEVIRPTEFQCKVTSFRLLTPSTFELAFETDRPMKFIAGQFVSIVVPGAGPNGRDLRRAYSIASSPEKTFIELCVKLVEEGPGSQYLNRLREGDAFRMFAPYGDFLFRPKEGRNVLFISTGTGIAPFRSMMLSQYFESNTPVYTTCLSGVRTPDEILYPELAEQFPDIRFIQALSQPPESWNGFKGRVTDFMKGLGADFPWSSTEYYLCGHGVMIAEIKALLWEKGVTKDSVHQEIYYK